MYLFNVIIEDEEVKRRAEKTRTRQRQESDGGRRHEEAREYGWNCAEQNGSSRHEDMIILRASEL